MAFEYYVRSGQEKLRMGYTTGTCAALAAKAACEVIFSGTVPETVSVLTPKGITVDVEPHVCEVIEPGRKARVCIIKDAGDDADVTNGTEVWSEVTLTDTEGIVIDGGEGVGRVTKAGLDQPVGNAAINSGPRSQITAAVAEMIKSYEHPGGATVIVSIPAGKELAKHTFNPIIGIEGGISVLGTSGIVEPMSEAALVATIDVTMKQARLESDRLIITPGNYGENFIENGPLGAPTCPVVKSSNFIGETLDMAALYGFKEVILIGHIGKIVKVAAGVMNTHSKYADGRNEVFCAHAAVHGANRSQCERLMNAATTDACIEILDETGIREEVMASITDAVQRHLDIRVRDRYICGAVLFSNVYSTLGITDKAKQLMEVWTK
ncbi:MAG: cobalamin biosynthesis protein CbiD [Eubacteriaceae bacterium]|nr:cobalamin biosynthesis protein CbiD [Eubacteriaceae bacterium]